MWKQRTKLAAVVMWEEETARHWDILRDSEGLGEALKDSEGFYVSRNILRRLGGFGRGQEVVGFRWMVVGVREGEGRVGRRREGLRKVGKVVW